jgi:hypothetical protein
MSLTKLSLGGNNLYITSLFPPRESLVSVIPAGDGNIEKHFLRCSPVYHSGKSTVERSKSSALDFFIDGSKTRYTERRKIKRGRVGMIVGGGGEVRGYSNKIDDSQFERGPVSLLSIHSPSTNVSVSGFDRNSSTFLENALCVGEVGHERLNSLKLQLG